MLRGYAPLLGVFGVSLVLVLLAAALVLVLFGNDLQRLSALILATLLLIGGWFLAQIQWTHKAGRPIDATVVQGNVPQELKWDPDAFRDTLKKYAKLSQGYWNSDVVIWPEAAIPGLYRQVENGYLPEVEKAQKAGGADWLVGVLAADPEMEHYYNTVMEAGDPPKFYVKRHLVPFGEYFPVPETVRRWLRLMNLPYTDFTPGADEQPLLHIKGVPVSVSICYEIVFGRVIRHDMPEAKLLINVSNDAWFGRSIGPDQHFQIARMRAIEVGRELLRVTNTGISGVVGVDGEVRRRAPQFEALAFHAMVTPYEGETPYIWIGNAGVLALLALLQGLSFLIGRVPGSHLR